MQQSETFGPRGGSGDGEFRRPCLGRPRSGVSSPQSAGQILATGRHDRLLAQLLGGRADANVGFEAMCALLRRRGFQERTRGSHHLFRPAGVEELINLQRDGNKAKVHQVRRVRAVLVRYGLTTIEEDEAQARTGTN